MKSLDVPLYHSHACAHTCGLRHCHNKYILCTASYKTLCRNVCDFPNNFK